MKLLARFRSFASALVHRSRLGGEIDEELRAHIQDRANHLERSGLSRVEAERRARLEFGGYQKFKEECREARGTRLIESLLQDIRFGFRMLRKSPGFTAVAILTLALGIGANTAIFSVLNAVVLSPLPVSKPQQLVALSQTDNRGNRYMTFAYPVFEQIRDHNQSLGGVAAFLYLPRPVTAIAGGRANLASAMLASSNYFSVLGVAAVRGRVFTDADRVSGNDHVAVLSHNYWTRRFNQDPSVIGKGITVSGTLLTIIGVTPADFYGIEVGRSPDLTIPDTMQPELISVGGQSFLNNPQVPWLEMIARLRPGAKTSTAQADMSALLEHLHIGPRDALPVELIPISRGFDSGLRTEFAPTLQLLMILTMIVLLVTCVNVGGMLLVRGQVRSQEITVRRAIGASAKRLFCQLLTESALLVGLAGLAGLFVGLWCSRALVSMMSTVASPISIRVPLDAPVIIFTVTISLLACVAFGVFPVFQAARLNLIFSLNQGAGATVRGPARPSVSKLLVVSQVALSALLLIGAGLFVRSLRDLSRINLGFDANHLLLFSIDPPAAKGAVAGQLNHLYLRLQNKLQTQPGIRSATFSVGGPMGGGWGQKITERDGRNVDIVVSQAAVGPDYFKTMTIPIFEGRDFAATDDSQSPAVAALSRSAAQIVFGDSNPIGRRVHVADSALAPTDSNFLQIIGVVGDTRFSGLRSSPPPIIYTSYLQHELGGVTFEIRTNAGPRILERTVREDVASIDPRMPVFDFEPMRNYLGDLLCDQRALAIASTAFSLLVLLLAALGIYGTLSYSVGQQTHEIGIRVALGAQRRDLLHLVISQGILLVLIGGALGIGVSIGVTRFIASLLYGVSPNDPVTLALVCIILLAVALPACYIPARRAMKVDPMVALRYE
jgi:predicted permease